MARKITIPEELRQETARILSLIEGNIKAGSEDLEGHYLHAFNIIAERRLTDTSDLWSTAYYEDFLRQHRLRLLAHYKKHKVSPERKDRKRLIKYVIRLDALKATLLNREALLLQQASERQKKLKDARESQSKGGQKRGKLNSERDKRIRRAAKAMKARGETPREIRTVLAEHHKLTPQRIAQILKSPDLST